MNADAECWQILPCDTILICFFTTKKCFQTIFCNIWSIHTEFIYYSKKKNPWMETWLKCPSVFRYRKSAVHLIISSKIILFT